MIVTLADAKNYLRVDHNYDDTLITTLINSAQRLCEDVTRLDTATFESKGDVAKTAVLYTLAYFYENRVGADYKELPFTLRSLLYSIREV